MLSIDTLNEHYDTDQLKKLLQLQESEIQWYQIVADLARGIADSTFGRDTANSSQC